MPRRAHAPDHVADVVRDEERAPLVDGDPDRAAERPVAGVEEAAQDIDGRTRRFAVRERNEDHFVPAENLAIPRSMLTDEHAVPECRQLVDEVLQLQTSSEILARCLDVATKHYGDLLG